MSYSLALVFLSGIGFSVQSLIIHKLREKYQFTSTFEIVFIRGFVQALLVFALIVWNEKRKSKDLELLPIVSSQNSSSSSSPTNITKPLATAISPYSFESLFGQDKTPYLLLLRSSSGFGGIACAFLSLSLLPIGDAIVLVMLAPTISAILAAIILKEPWHKPEMGGTVLSLIGCALVSRPSLIFPVGGDELDKSLNVTGICFALLASFFSGTAYISVRMLGTSNPMPWTHVCFSQALGQLVFAVPFLFLFKQEFVLPTNTENFEIMGLMFLCGVIGASSQFCMTIGMQKEKSASATMMR